MSVFNKKVAQGLWKDYYHATKWAHHHTMMVLGGLIIAGTMLSWQATNFMDGATHADWTPTWCQDNSGSLQIPESECDVLLDLYLATDGDNWNNSQQNNSKWFQGNGSNICRNGWYGVNGCERDMMSGKYHIQSLNLDNNGLSGTLTNSIYTLSHLSSIYLHNNGNLDVNIDDITSSAYASNYQAINVSNDSIHGDITNFSNLTNLQYLDVACYYTANFDNCDASGSISFVPSLSKLYGLKVGGHVGVTFDLNYLSNSPQVTDIFALNNYIVGSIDVLTGNTGMTDLDLGCWDLLEGQCNASGHMSTLANMNNLHRVSFDGLFNIEGTLDVLSGKTQLQAADFSHNLGLYGTLDGIKNIPDMQDFDINDTSIGGTLPTEMYNWVNLNDLNIHENQLNGPLLEFSRFTKLQGLHLGSNDLDYSNLWDMLLGDDTVPPPACVPTPAKPCVGKPFHSALQNLEINHAEVGGELPDMWDHFTDLTRLDLQFDRLTGQLPASMASLTNLNDLRIHFNNFDGQIPTFLANLSLDQGSIKMESNCFDTDVSDPDLLSLLHDHAQGWNNQLNCRANVQVSGALDASGLVAGSCSTYTISYENLGPQKAVDVTIGQTFDDGLVVSGSVPPYSTGLVGRTYGTLDDPCYVNAVEHGTGPYYAWIDNLMVTNYEIPSLYSLAVYQGGFTGAQGTTELGFVLDQFCPMIFSTSDRSLCFLLFGSSFDDIDPSCGTGGVPGYKRDLGTIQAGGTGSIEVNLCVPEDFSGSVSFGSKVSTVSTNENENSSDQNFQFIIQAPNGNGTGNTGTGDNGGGNGGGGNGGGGDNGGDTGGSTPPPTGNHRSAGASITKDKCLPNPPGDQSASYYDGECDGTGHNSASDSGEVLFDPKSYLADLTDVRNYVRDLPEGISVDVEQIKAFLFAKRSKLTNMMDYMSFDPDGVLTRGTWAKFLVAFAENVLGKKANNDRLPICAHTYTDVGNDLGDLKDYIIKACLFQYMGVENDRTTPLTVFNPNEILTRKDLATVISRVIRGSKNDGVSPYWAKHAQALYEAGLIRNTDPEIVDSRVNAITILMRATEQYDTLFGNNK